MPKLLNIKGYWKEHPYSEFNEKDIWEGKILLEEDGWFEGIARDPNSSYTEDRFIFGVYYPGQTIELFKFCPLAITSPFIYHADKMGEEYYGDTKVIDIPSTYYFGLSLIKTNEFTEEMGNIEEETKSLENAITSYKENDTTPAVKVFYDRMKRIRGSIGKLCLLTLKNSLVSYEQRDKFNYDFSDRYDNCIDEYLANSVVESYRQKAKRLNLDFDTIPNDNGFPFEL